CKYVSYVEWYYRYPPVDSTSDTVQREEDGRAMAISQNAPTLVDIAQADLVLCPTHFQAEQFPSHIRDRLVVMHDGVDMTTHAPAETPQLPASIDSIPADAEIITYATRGMEPHRGFPEFMRALERLQARRPNLYAIIVGADRVAYGKSRQDGKSWKEQMQGELTLDESRIVWTGLLSRNDYIKVLQSTHAHVYLTVPFVLSWSLIEAMSIACPLVVSDSPPVREVLQNGHSAEMVQMRDIDAITDRVEHLLTDRDAAQRLGRAARTKALTSYDNRWIWPARKAMLEDLHHGRLK
ncbi:MAG: glycosyltransferase, partial [Pseudomonadota bacterium]